MTADEKLRREDREHLIKQPQFQRHLFEIIASAHIMSATHEEQRALFLEGKRSLGLEILGWFTAEAEPHDVISTAINSRILFSKGTKRDDRNDQYE